MYFCSVVWLHIFDSLSRLVYILCNFFNRYIDVIIYGCKSWCCKDAKKKHFEELMVNEDADAALLRLLECFIEAAPQLTLQLYILCVHGTEENLILSKLLWFYV